MPLRLRIDPQPAQPVRLAARLAAQTGHAARPASASSPERRDDRVLERGAGALAAFGAAPRAGAGRDGRRDVRGAGFGRVVG